LVGWCAVAQKIYREKTSEDLSCPASGFLFFIIINNKNIKNDYS
jgi:hypothetical protein